MTTKLSVENAHALDKNIVFFEEDHKYTILTDPGVNYTSVTTFIHSLFEKFDADKIIDKMMNSKNWNSKNKYFGMTKQQIKDQWNSNGKAVSSSGTLMHAFIEKFMNLDTGLRDSSHSDLKEVFEREKPFDDLMMNSVEWKYFMNYIDMFPDFIPYRTEWVIYDMDLKLAGSIDMVYKSEDSLLIYDWKRCKDITKNNPFQKYSVIPCLDTIPDTNFWHYSLQLNIYKYILEKNYGKKITQLFLVQLHPDCKNFQCIKVPDLSNLLLDVIEYRMSCL